MRRRRRAYGSDLPVYASETAMCERLRELAREAGFRVYPETGGWDLLFVRPEDGFQVGIQAKMRPNVEVLYQTIRGSVYARKGPDVRAIAVPTATAAIIEVARALRVLVLEVSVLDAYSRDVATAGSRRRGQIHLEDKINHATVWENPGGREWVPPIESSLPAGTPAPRTLSKWKVSAARICAIIRDEGSITGDRLRELGGSLSTWRAWLDPVDGTKPRRYARNRFATALPDETWRELAAEIVAAGI